MTIVGACLKEHSLAVTQLYMLRLFSTAYLLARVQSQKEQEAKSEFRTQGAMLSFSKCDYCNWRFQGKVGGATRVEGAPAATRDGANMLRGIAVGSRHKNSLIDEPRIVVQPSRQAQVKAARGGHGASSELAQT